MKQLEEIREMAKEGRKPEAIALLEQLLEAEQEGLARETLLLELGILYNGIADFPRALNAFNAVSRINPDNTAARTYIAMITSILNYYNKDLLNP